MTTYKIIKNEIANGVFYEYIERTDENGGYAMIPMDESNSDYKTYLASLETPAE